MNPEDYLAEESKPFTYNSERPDILFKEYGRHIQSLVKYILTEENRENRTRKAHLVIELMRQLNPALKELPDAQQKLWDHLHIMANFQLDVDAPYPIPNKEELHQPPQPLRYCQQEIKYKHYGKHIELLIEKVKQIEDEVLRQQAALQVARLMKMLYAEWNKENIEDEIIVRQLQEMSGGVIQLDLQTIKAEDLLDVKNYKATTPPAATHSNKKSKSKKDKKRKKRR